MEEFPQQLFYLSYFPLISLDNQIFVDFFSIWFGIGLVLNGDKADYFPLSGGTGVLKDRGTRVGSDV